MNTLDDFLQRFAKVGIFIGGVFLIAAMLLLISNILGRFINFVIPGSYELFELFMVIPVAAALVYSALNASHVVVNLLVSRFPPKLAAISEIAAGLMSFVTWGGMAYAGAHLAYENGLREMSDVLKIPYLPFRIVWVFCLFVFSLVYFSDLYRSFRRSFRK